MAYRRSDGVSGSPPKAAQRRKEMRAHGYTRDLDSPSQIASFASRVLGMNSAQIGAYLRADSRALARERARRAGSDQA